MYYVNIEICIYYIVLKKYKHIHTYIYIYIGLGQFDNIYIISINHYIKLLS
jgi:hypothetical protein